MRNQRVRLWAGRAICGMLLLAVALAVQYQYRGHKRSGAGRLLPRVSAGVALASETDSDRGTSGDLQYGPNVVVAGEYRVELVRLEVGPDQPRSAVLSVELRRCDGGPIPGDVTLDTAVSDNRLVNYNVGCAYEEFGEHGEEVSTAKEAKTYRMLQTLRIGPLHDRVQWFAIGVTIYTQKPRSGRPHEFDLVPLHVVDLGKHPVSGAPPIGSAQSVSLAGREVPVYPGARDVDVRHDQSLPWGSLSYVLPGLPYPSRDVEAFYSEWALAHGWVADQGKEASWQGFTDATGDAEILVEQLWVEWTERESGDRLVVVCQYRRPVPRGVREQGPPARMEEQIVHVGVYPAESAGRE